MRDICLEDELVEVGSTLYQHVKRVHKDDFSPNFRNSTATGGAMLCPGGSKHVAQGQIFRILRELRLQEARQDFLYASRSCTNHITTAQDGAHH